MAESLNVLLPFSARKDTSQLWQEFLANVSFRDVVPAETGKFR
jgi:hypothetical protein